jgi:hypothetical protein
VATPPIGGSATVGVSVRVGVNSRLDVGVGVAKVKRVGVAVSRLSAGVGSISITNPIAMPSTTIRLIA